MVKRNLPKPPKLLKMLGPSFILLGLGLGSGELILWPYLASKYGLGIIWGAVLGITFQFFINMEIERYTLATGESIFVGFSRLLKKFSPIWFIFSTLIPWMWPGIIASSAVIIASLLGIKYSKIIPIILLLLIGLILTLGPVIYKTQEYLQRTLIILGIPLIFFITFLVVKPVDWQVLLSGIVGRGDGYLFFPAGISLLSFLGAFAYSGAGGNLNLAQSYYIKEKGYGMGKYSGRITSIFTGKKEEVKLKGSHFKLTPRNEKLFKVWWRRINIEHFFIFWLTGTLTMLALALLSYSTTFTTKNLDNQNMAFLFNQAVTISERTIPILGTIFLLIASLMLFSTQFSIMDATSRIMSENLVILSSKIFKIKQIRIYYYIFLWLQILLGISVFSLGIIEPLKLVTIGAVLNAFAMFFFTGLLMFMSKFLKKISRPKLARTLALGLAFSFYGIFSFITIYNIFK